MTLSYINSRTINHVVIYSYTLLYGFNQQLTNPSSCNEYDSRGNKLNNIMKPYNVRDCSSKLYFFPLYNTAPGYPDWFKNLSKDDLLNERGPQKYYLKEIIDEAFCRKGMC